MRILMSVYFATSETAASQTTFPHVLPERHLQDAQVGWKQGPFRKSPYFG